MTEHVEVSGNIVFDSADPVTVELARGQRGGYGWTIKVKGRDQQEVLDKIHAVDQALRTEYITTAPEGA